MDMNKVLLLFSLFLSLLSCDAVNRVAYTVKNKQSSVIRIYVPFYSPNGGYSHAKDTVLTLKPGEERHIATSMMKIGFPSDSKKIYRESPGICGVKLITADSAKTFGCTQKEWKYHGGMSTLKIK